MDGGSEEIGDKNIDSKDQSASKLDSTCPPGLKLQQIHHAKSPEILKLWEIILAGPVLSFSA